jgi:hypothetical protein
MAKKVITQTLTVEVTIVTNADMQGVFEDNVDYAVHSMVEGLPMYNPDILASTCMVTDHGEGTATLKTDSQLLEGDFDDELGL